MHSMFVVCLYHAQYVCGRFISCSTFVVGFMHSMFVVGLYHAQYVCGRFISCTVRLW